METSKEEKTDEIPLLSEPQHHQQNQNLEQNEELRTDSRRTREMIELEDSNALDIDSEARLEEGQERMSRSNENNSLIVNVQSRRGTVLWALWFSVVNISLIIGLILDREHHCDSALKSWAVIQVCIQFLMGVCSVYLHWKLQRPNNSYCSVTLIYFIARITNIFWIGWNCTGIVWTFQAFSCVKTMPTLYLVCFVLAIIHTLIFGLPFLVSCCSLPLLFLMLLFCPERIGRNRPKKISLSKIKSLTTTKKFEEGLMNPEDANCAICLEDYERGQEIRYLPCGHCFHSECILQWLPTNKTCPFCKMEIDSKPKDKQNNPNSTLQQS